MSLENKKVLVTGGAGFIGSNIIEYLLNKNNKVTCLDNLITGKKENVNGFLSNPNFTMVEGDITNLEDCFKTCQNIDVILHQFKHKLWWL
jgi:UDP-N-acetylglucosamine 4-epimerase